MVALRHLDGGQTTPRWLFILLLPTIGRVVILNGCLLLFLGDLPECVWGRDGWLVTPGAQRLLQCATDVQSLPALEPNQCGLAQVRLVGAFGACAGWQSLRCGWAWGAGGLSPGGW